MCERPLETLTGSADSQDAFLSGLRGPTAAIHNPQKLWLDPSHAVELERRDESPGGDIGLDDRLGIGLVDDDGMLDGTGVDSALSTA